MRTVGCLSQPPMKLCWTTHIRPDFLPVQLWGPSYTVSRTPSTSTPISAFIYKATHVDSLIFSFPITEPLKKPNFDPYEVSEYSSAVAQFKQETWSMIDFVEDSLESRRFEAFEIKSLAMLQDEFGRHSDEYVMAVRTLEGILSHVCRLHPSSRHRC
jgi:hypothetical protein